MKDITISAEQIEEACRKFYAADQLNEYPFDIYLVGFTNALEKYIDDVLENPNDYTQGHDVLGHVDREVYKAVKEQERKQAVGK